MSLKINKDFYFGLISIPFHQNRSWKTKSEYIISKWYKMERRGIASVLHSYSLYPDSVLKECLDILENWKIEIREPINQVYGVSTLW